MLHFHAVNFHAFCMNEETLSYFVCVCVCVNYLEGMTFFLTSFQKRFFKELQGCPLQWTACTQRLNIKQYELNIKVHLTQFYDTST